MKSPLYLFVLLCLALSLPIILPAQPYYFSQRNEAYSDLSGGTTINGASVWSGFQTFNVPIGFSFPYMGTSFTSVTLEATGRLIFDVNHYYYADMFVVSGMRDKGTTSSQSPLSYQVSGAAPIRVLKIEVKNATYQNDQTSTVSFQIWLYEQNSGIELHMGPNSITNPSQAFPSGPFSGVNHVSNFSPMTYVYGLGLHGNPLLPSDSTFSGTGINSFGIKLNGIPPEGAVYVFSDALVGIDPGNFSAFSISPNPGGEYIRFDWGIIRSDVVVRIYDPSGKVLLSHSFSDCAAAELSIGSLPQGLHFVSLECEGKIKTARFLKY